MCFFDLNRPVCACRQMERPGQLQQCVLLRLQHAVPEHQGLRHEHHGRVRTCEGASRMRCRGALPTRLDAMAAIAKNWCRLECPAFGSSNKRMSPHRHAACFTLQTFLYNVCGYSNFKCLPKGYTERYQYGSVIQVRRCKHVLCQRRASCQAPVCTRRAI